MANVVIFNPNREPDILLSVNTVDYCDIPPENDKGKNENGEQKTDLPKDQLKPKANIVLNPNLDALKNTPKKYWKKVDNRTIEEMTPQEKAVVDLTIGAEQQKKEESFENITPEQLAKALVKLGIVKKADLIQTLKEANNG